MATLEEERRKREGYYTPENNIPDPLEENKASRARLLIDDAYAENAPGPNKKRIEGFFGRLDPEEEAQHQAARVSDDMRELEGELRDQFRELFRLIEQMNVERVKAYNASDSSAQREKNHDRVNELSNSIQRELSKGLVAVIPDLGVSSHEKIQIVELSRTYVGREEVGSSSSTLNIEVSSHESLGAALQEKASKEAFSMHNLLGTLSELSTTVGFAIQGLILADDNEAIAVRDELIRQQGELKSILERCEEGLLMAETPFPSQKTSDDKAA